MIISSLCVLTLSCIKVVSEEVGSCYDGVEVADREMKYFDNDLLGNLVGVTIHLADNSVVKSLDYGVDKSLYNVASNIVSGPGKKYKLAQSDGV